MILAASLSSNPRALWYLTRGFGLVALILLTLTMVLGLAQTVRFARPGWPRFVVSALHKNASLLAVAVLTVHILTAVLDSYAPIRVVDIFVPFVGKYRPLWLGLGALAVDLLLALVVTSLLRERLGHRAWRAVHWAAYVCWPVAVLHGLGTGSDTKLGWVLLLNVVCVAAVVAALWWRWQRRVGRERQPARCGDSGQHRPATRRDSVDRHGAVAPGVGPQAGTPAALIGSHPVASPPTASAGGSPRGSTSNVGFVMPFSASFRGSQQQSGPDNNGLVSVTISGTFNGAQPGRLRIVLTGQPAGRGGVDLTGSQVILGPSAAPTQYQGHVTQLSGSTLVAALTDTKGHVATATVQLQLDAGSTAVGGTVTVAS